MTTLAVTSVSSLLCQASTCFRIGSKLRCIRSTPTEMQSMSEKDLECFARTGVKSPANAIFEQTNTRYPQVMANRMLLSWELRNPMEKRHACFDEEAQHMGENGPCQPNVALPIHLNKPAKELDEEVRRVFDHASAMLRSLASAARIVELVRDLYDEYLRQHRLMSGLPAEPGLAGVREEQL